MLRYSISTSNESLASYTCPKDMPRRSWLTMSSNLSNTAHDDVIPEILYMEKMDVSRLEDTATQCRDEDKQVMNHKIVPE